MNSDKVTNIPVIKITTIKRDENGFPELKQINLPNNKVEHTNQLNNLADGVYYGIYEICEIIDKRIMNKYVVAYDTKTKETYKITEEIQHLLEKVPQNLHFSRNDLPNKYGYYIHEKAMEAIFKRLERRTDVEQILKELFLGKKATKSKEQLRHEQAEKINIAQANYLKEDTKPKTYSKVKKQKIKKDIAKMTAALLIVASTAIAIATPKHSEPIIEKPTTQQIEASLAYTEPVVNLTNNDLCDYITLGKEYKISPTIIYESSDHNGKVGSIKEGYYTIAMVAIINENNIIHTISMKNDGLKKISDLIPKEELEKAKYKSAAISTSDGTIIGWINIDTNNFKDLTEQAKNFISPILINNVESQRGR